MRPIAFVAAVQLLALTAVAQNQREVDEALPQLVQRVQQMVQQAPEFEGIRIHGAAIVDRPGGEGRDIRFRAEGGDVEQRARLHEAITAEMQNDPFWSQWLQAGGVNVVYTGPIRDPGPVRPIQPSPEEQARIDELLAIVQDRIETSPQLGGAYVRDAVLVRRVDGPGYALRIRGHIPAEDQRPVLSEVFTEVMAEHPYWRERRSDVFVSLEPMSIVPPSLQWGLRYFTMGLNEFWCGNLFEAERAFSLAIAHAPDVVVYRWWKVVTLIALGQEGRAQSLLVPLLQVNPWGQYDATIAVALERVQGPLRHRLQELEQHVLLNVIP